MQEQEAAAGVEGNVAELLINGYLAIAIHCRRPRYLKPLFITS